MGNRIAWIGVAASVLALGCGDANQCTAKLPGEFGCANPDDCLAVIATWNFPGAASTGSADIDLTLTLPDDGVVGSVSGTTSPTGGCVHSGDVEAAGSEETSESIICAPPDNTGDYLIGVKTLFFFDISIRLDINKDGVTSCEVVDVDVRRELPLSYP